MTNTMPEWLAPQSDGTAHLITVDDAVNALNADEVLRAFNPEGDPDPAATVPPSSGQ
jgi:hypothetical protein